MVKFEEGVAHRVDRNGNVKRVDANNGVTVESLPEMARKKPTDNKAEQGSVE